MRGNGKEHRARNIGEGLLSAHRNYDCIKVETDAEGITWITLNRPQKRNAMSPTLHFEMEEALMKIETDEATKVVVLTGAGNSWSAGMDLKEYFRETDKNPELRFKSLIAIRRWTELLTWTRKPTIAMINGFCFGGAFAPLAACDIVIAADEATFGLSEVNWGIIPGGNISKVFSDLVNHRDALFYAMTGRTFDGRKAVDMGVANLSVPLDRLRDETVTVARELMAKGPAVLAYTKQAVRAVRDMSMEQSWEYLGAKSQALRGSDPEGTRERGMREFLDNKSYRPGLAPVKRP
jgi:trans-feruloyl-CoA hydratase/vanillin synthase